MVPLPRCLGRPVADRSYVKSRPQRQCHLSTMQAAFKTSIRNAGDRVRPERAPAKPTYGHVWFAIAASLGYAGT